MRKPYGEDVFQGSDGRVLLKSYYLRLFPRLLLLPVFFLAGALIAAAVYFCVHVVYGPGRVYAGGARLYLEFSPDAAGNARDFYNAWTWKELITSDEILDTAMGELIGQGLSPKEQGSGTVLTSDGTTVKSEDDELVLISGDTAAGITRAEVLESVTVRMPSDLRVMMLTVTNRDRDRTDAILKAMLTALTRYGETNEVFREIRVLESTPALLMVFADRTVNAVIFGGILGAIVGLFILLLKQAADDAVYDPESAGRRFGLPVLGIVPAEKSAGSEKTAEEEARYLAELTAAIRRRLPETGQSVFFSAGKPEDAERVCAGLEKAAGSSPDGQSSRIAAVRELTAQTGEIPYQAAVLGIPWGRQAGARAEHLLSVCDALELPVSGLVLYDADLRYLRRLYGKW